ncbi:MAG TPA: thiamine phosphate synthase [Nitrospirae bacterium]|nr:thiamine phosphate synthase [Nitrospirota bacterium]
MSKRPIAKTRIGKDEGRKSKRINFRLYLITDRSIVHRQSSIVKAVELALKGGVRAIQLREKDMGTRELLKLAYKMREYTNKYNARLFINDRVDIALAVEADGVHLTQNSIPVDAVRKAVNASRFTRHTSRLLIGVSTHSLKEARQAEINGADFITFGPVYKTPSKLKYGDPVGTDRLKRAVRQISIPVFAIGGVKGRNISELKRSGAHGIAMISGIFEADNIKEKAKEIINLLEERWEKMHRISSYRSFSSR